MEEQILSNNEDEKNRCCEGQDEQITRKEAFKKMGKYAAYSAAVVTVLFAAPDKAHAS